jgi:hypothetical protein
VEEASYNIVVFFDVLPFSSFFSGVHFEAGMLGMKYEKE